MKFTGNLEICRWKQGKKKVCRVPVGFGVRPPGYFARREEGNGSNNEESGTECEESMSASSERSINLNNRFENGMAEGRKAGGSIYPRYHGTPFKIDLPWKSQKAEWLRWSVEFQFNMRMMGRGNDETFKLDAIPVFGGSEVQKVMMDLEIAGKVVEKDLASYWDELGKHFASLTTAEEDLMTLQQMKQGEETFNDFIVKLQAQAKLTDLTSKELNREMVTAVTTRSKPSVAKELMKERVARDMNLMDLIRLGRHLDEVKDLKPHEELVAIEGKVAEVLAIDKFKGKRDRKASHSPDERESGYGRRFRSNEDKREYCNKCLGRHSIGTCPASGKECHNCRGVGHFIRACRNPRKDWRDGGRRERQKSSDFGSRWQREDRPRFDRAKQEARAVNQVKRSLKKESDDE